MLGSKKALELEITDRARAGKTKTGKPSFSLSEQSKEKGESVENDPVDHFGQALP